MRLRRVVLAVGFSTTLLAVCRMIADQVTAMGVEVLKNEVDNGDGANGLYFTTADRVSRVTVVHGERETVRESLEFTDSERSLPTPVKSPDRPLHPQVLLGSQFGQEPSALYLREQGGPGAGVVVVAQDKRADYEGKLPRANQDHSAPVEQAMEGKVQLFELGHVSTFPPKTFRVRTPFHFPQPLAVQPLTQVLHSQWMEELRETVNSMQCDQITMVTSNLPYREVLLNWLVSAIVRAKIPLQSILVISMDEPVHRVLKEKGVNSVLTTPASFLSGSVRSMGTFPQVMMTRLAIIRLLNHWGFHVVNYDTDAIILRNPQDVFDRLSESGVIGTFGKFPKQLNRLWGVTLCTAVLVVRSSPETELLWESLSREHLSSFSDQDRMNLGLKALGIRWALQANLQTTTKEVVGVCRNGLKVSLLPYSVSCRAGNCQSALRDVYYVWHKGGSRDGSSKKRSAEVGRTWFLRSDWQDCCSAHTGYDWFRNIATALVFT